ncbi:MAG: flagellar assembly protein FliW [Gemmatimonadaceae bacterium]|nr:flagellar assembly protein FliW [Gemmatimonadaceae bacterium]
MTATMPTPTTFTLHSDLLGDIEMPEDAVLSFPEGLLGFPECHRWALVDGARSGTFWLQSLDHAPLAFLLLDPFQFFDDYAVEVAMRDRARLDAAETNQVAVLAIVTLGKTIEEPCSVNLQGPLLIDMAQRRGIQIILDDTRFGVRAPIAAQTLLS